MSHTGFFGGSYDVAAGAFRQAGIIAVDSCEELAAVARALAMQPQARGTGIAMISNGAGTMVQAMDLMEGSALTLPALAESTVSALKAVYPPYYLSQNPVDVTGSASSADYEVGIRALMEDPNVDIVMPWFVFQDTALDEGIVEVLAQASARHEKPILCGSMGGPFTEKISREIQERGVPMYHTVREWVAAAKGLASQ
jgi:3-hydroxypropionyl-CoA synthetase (ADP-forming)